MALVRIGISSLGAALLFLSLSACARSSTEKAEEPARVSGHVAEADLITVTLSPEAETRLGIETVLAARQLVAQTRLLGGEVIAPASGASAVTRYAATSTMDPADLAAAQIRADATLASARAALDLARTRYARTETLHERNFASDRAMDDARAELRIAEAALRGAMDERALFGQSVSSTEPPLRVWVRVSVYAGDLDRLNRRANAHVRGLGAGGAARPAAPIAAPATAGGPSSNAFFFYEVDNRDGAFRMGERVEVAVPATTQHEGLAVPYSAILYDVNGGEWVYERTAAQVYSRKRVEVQAIVGDLAVLTRGPPEGALIVSVGAAELFGTEFGVSH